MSPILNDAFSPVFAEVLEGAAKPAGLTVADLPVNGSISDPNGVVEAIAITGLNTSLGSVVLDRAHDALNQIRTYATRSFHFAL